ncbi:3-hydroxyisobutyrate dehydrogenase [Ralstonia syzygii]|uniref:3-hydroxyisobutyrate dehydrogenase n=1 Tax=Ralstonia syzygii TaxID=28097 RepID=A0ABX7ZH91_9RALS|nr:NAD(P)-binding domain-containing protein [Ralstonia syzygii]QUP54608.1 3-hydroxyisobutyrate dehydrogenase [Ralstonia syzygii]
MKIGIIGTGNIGGALARKLSAAGHDVRVANSSGTEGARAFAREIGAEPTDVHGAVAGVNVIILAIPLPAMRELPANLFDRVPIETTIIDTSNYYPGLRDSRIPEIDDGLTESAWVARQIGRPVIKAFNNALAYTLAELGKPKGTPSRLAIAVAGDDVRSKQTAMELVNQAGFDPVDAGSLEDSWRQQPSTPSYCCDYDAETMREALAAAIPGVAAMKRDQLPEHFAKLGSNPSHADVVAMNRRVNSAVG